MACKVVLFIWGAALAMLFQQAVTGLQEYMVEARPSNKNREARLFVHKREAENKSRWQNGSSVKWGGER